MKRHQELSRENRPTESNQRTDEQTHSLLSCEISEKNDSHAYVGAELSGFDSFSSKWMTVRSRSLILCFCKCVRCECLHSCECLYEHTFDNLIVLISLTERHISTLQTTSLSLLSSSPSLSSSSSSCVISSFHGTEAATLFDARFTWISVNRSTNIHAYVCHIYLQSIYSTNSK